MESLSFKLKETQQSPNLSPPRTEEDHETEEDEMTWPVAGVSGTLDWGSFGHTTHLFLYFFRNQLEFTKL